MEEPQVVTQEEVQVVEDVEEQEQEHEEEEEEELVRKPCPTGPANSSYPTILASRI